MFKENWLKKNYLEQIILFCPTELGIQFLSSFNFKSTEWKMENIKDGETVDRWNSFSRQPKKAAETAILALSWYSCSGILMSLHRENATWYFWDCRYFWFLSSSVHKQVLDSHSGKQQQTEITLEPHSYKLNVTESSFSNVLVLAANTSRKQLRRAHKQ